MRKTYGEALNSYDVLKGIAVVIMVMFHTGMYFLPVQHWLMIPGVLVTVPFFLMGYARTRAVPVLWIAGGLALMLAAIGTGGAVLPINVLFSFIFIRLIIDDVADFVLRNTAIFIGAIILFAALALPTSLLIEYGTFGILCALFGYIRRHEVPLPAWLMGFLLFVIWGFSCLLISMFMPPLALYCYLIMAVLAAVGLYGLYKFKPVSWPEMNRRMPLLAGSLQLFGRWSFEIYVIHVLIFRAVAFFAYPDLYHFSGLKILPFGLS